MKPSRRITQKVIGTLIGLNGLALSGLSLWLILNAPQQGRNGAALLVLVFVGLFTSIPAVQLVKGGR